jgi:uncharacterized phage-associated protein
MCNVFDVARYILEEVGEVSTMKLQKLCYYSLVEGLISTPKLVLFKERFEAWANGPVCRELWNVHKGHFSITKTMIPKNLLSNDISLAYKKCVNKVISKYGTMEAEILSELTHKEKPWMDAIKNVNTSSNSNKTITHKAIIDYYSGKRNGQIRVAH